MTQLKQIIRLRNNGAALLTIAKAVKISRNTVKKYLRLIEVKKLNTQNYSKKPFLTFFNKEIIDRRTISQGFLVITNDMHGKMKSQAAYSERDENTPLSASY